MKILNKIFLTCIILFLFTSCSPVRNVPYIDTTETLQLQVGMKKDEIVSILGEPVLVKSGEKQIIEWGYEVRYKTVSSGANSFPSKRGKYVGTTFSHNMLILVFENNELTKWYSDNQVIPGKPFAIKANPIETVIKVIAGTLIFSILADG